LSAKRRDYEELPDEELPAEQDAMAREAIVQAERDLEAMRVDFRWGKAQVDIVKRAAKLFGVPYQTYMKDIVFRQALADLRAAKELAESA
jgi:predicted DNA binding CopG/RHH family protein